MNVESRLAICLAASKRYAVELQENADV